MFDQKLLLELQEYIEEHSIRIFEELVIQQDMMSEPIRVDELEDFIEITRKPSFREVLFSFIDRRKAVDSDVYKRAGIDRRHFSKIRSNPDYRPGKNTVIALGIALELSRDETDQLLSSAGYSLSENDTFDLVIQFFIAKKIYKIHDINQALDYFNLKPLTR